MHSISIPFLLKLREYNIVISQGKLRAPRHSLSLEIYILP